MNDKDTAALSNDLENSSSFELARGAPATSAGDNVDGSNACLAHGWVKAEVRMPNLILIPPISRENPACDAPGTREK